MPSNHPHGLGGSPHYLAVVKLLSSPKGAPPLSSLDKDKEIDLELLQDLMEVDIDPLDIDLEKDPLAAKVFKVSWTLWLSAVYNVCIYLCVHFY